MEYPRLALATPAGGSDPSIAALAMLAGLTERRIRVQHFRSVACPTASEAVGQVSGLPGRHLDAWLMPCEVRRSLFVRGAGLADLSIVEGTFDETPRVKSWEAVCDRPGLLRPIVASLDLPVVAVVPCATWATGDGISHFPRIPHGVDAVLLDGLEDRSQLETYRRLIRLAYRIPLLGAVESLPGIRKELESTPKQMTLSEDAVRALARSFLQDADLGMIRELAESRPFKGLAQTTEACGGGRARVRVAYAQDEAFGRYFPDTLEAIEAMGAELVEFSPLRDEAVPEGADLVMIGCGFPDHYIDELAANESMITSLRVHVCRGNRIYSEGGGTAYLSRSMILPDRRVRGVGIFPFDARLLGDLSRAEPVARTLLHDSWLGPRGSVVRGYRSWRWNLLPCDEPLDCPSCFGALSADHDLIFHHHAVGSLIHLHLGALPEVVSAFAGPHRPSLRRPST